MPSLAAPLAAWARDGEALLQLSLAHPGPLTIGLVFAGGLLTSLGPCSLSLLPVTLAYLAGFAGSPAADGDTPKAASLPWQRSLSFAAGIVLALVLLGLISGVMGQLYGSLPLQVPLVVAVVAVVAAVETAVVTAVETVGNSKGAERPPFFV